VLSESESELGSEEKKRIISMTTTTEVNSENLSETIELLSILTQSQRDALAQKFAAQPKSTKKQVRELGVEGSEAEQYAVWILTKTANDYINAQMRDIWVQRLEMLIPRLTTKDEKLKAQTENAVMTIAAEITDVDNRADIQTLLKKNLLPKSTDMFTLIQCFERLETLFKNASKA
jgi:hypothetical protein